MIDILGGLQRFYIGRSNDGSACVLTGFVETLFVPDPESHENRVGELPACELPEVAGLIGNIFSIVLSTGFVVPWNWVMYGIIICSIVGLLAGLYPALKAGRLNPIEALRYE